MAEDDQTPEKLLAMPIGDSTVGENIAAAIADGRIIERPDGKLALAPSKQLNWVIVDNRPRLPCGFRTNILFEVAYAKTAVPHGCSACYKIKVPVKTLRQLVAAWKLAKGIDCLSKWGLDFGNPYSQDFYAGYFYAGDLDEARALYPTIRAAIDADPLLGPEVVMKIKRGCSPFEAAVGPADQYRFTPEMEALEAHLWSRFAPGTKAEQDLLPLGRWIDAAFRMGDNTYLDFTGGKRLRPESVTFAP